MQQIYLPTFDPRPSTFPAPRLSNAYLQYRTGKTRKGGKVAEVYEWHPHEPVAVKDLPEPLVKSDSELEPQLIGS